MSTENGDVIITQNPTDMLEQARNYLQRVQFALQESTDFDDILAIRDRGEFFRQYSRRQRYGIEIQNTVMGTDRKMMCGGTVTVRDNRLRWYLYMERWRRLSMLDPDGRWLLSNQNPRVIGMSTLDTYNCLGLYHLITCPSIPGPNIEKVSYGATYIRRWL